MSEPPSSSSLELRASDADRERVVDELREHCSAGRLTVEELDERVDSAYAARTLADLVPVTRDLPAVGTSTGVARRTAAVGPARKVSRWTVALMSGASRKGRWRVEPDTVSVALMGGVDIDMREAEFAAEETTITAFALMGGIDIVVPEGMEVDVEGFAVMGDKSARLADVPLRGDLPRLRVRAYALMGSVGVKSKSPRGEEKRRAQRHLPRH